MAFTLPLPPTGSTDPLVWGNYYLAIQNYLDSLIVPPIDAQYWVSHADPTLTNERNIGALSTGYLKITTALATATPTSTATIPAADISGGQALTRVDDTNVTLTVSADGAIALLKAVTLTMGWSGTLALARGGTAANLSATGGASQVLKQVSVGGAVTVGQLAFTDVSGTLGLAKGGTASDLSATGGASQVLRQSSSGAVVTVSQLASTDITGLGSGTYTPTLTGVANVGASTAYQCQYGRVGSFVTVSGKLDVDPTAAGSVQLGISLPIPSNLGANENCAGTAVCPFIAGQAASIVGDSTNDRAQMEYIAVDVTNQPMFFTFSYVVM